MKNSIILAFGADKNYLNKIHFQNYLDSIQKNSNFDKNILVFLGKEKIQINQNKIDVFNVDPDSIIKKTYINCLQHGEFLNSEQFNSLKESDVIIFTDGDMDLQRPLTEKEKDFLINLKDDDVYVGYNTSRTQNLFDEIGGIHLKSTYEDLVSKFNKDLTKIKCYNTGVLCMNKKTWIKLKNLYISKFDLVDGLFQHYAKQQWLICYIIGTENFNIFEMDYDFHNHNHVGPVEYTTIENNGVVKYKDNIVLFKHKYF